MAKAPLAGLALRRLVVDYYYDYSLEESLIVSGLLRPLLDFVEDGAIFLAGRLAPDASESDSSLLRLFLLFEVGKCSTSSSNFLLGGSVVLDRTDRSFSMISACLLLIFTPI